MQIKSYVKKPLSVLLVALSLVPLGALAALPPNYQNMKDLDVMVDFIKQHKRVSSTLKSIDMDSYSVHYGDMCIARFGRKTVLKPLGWVGPADPLEYKKSNCPINE